jgi:hypothetical protein
MPFQKNTSKYGPVVLILQKLSSPDDTLTITPSDDSDRYDVKFVQRTIGNTTYRSVRSNRIYDYLDFFVRALMIDTEGPTHVQIDVPTYPTVILNTNKVANYLVLLFDQIHSLERDWPYEFNSTRNQDSS